MRKFFRSATDSSGLVEQESVLRFFVAVELALMVTTSNFLLLNEQSLFQLDAVVSVAALTATGAIFSALYWWRNLYWRAALQALLVFLAIDLMGNDLRVAAIVGAVVPAFVIIKKRSLLFPASVFLGAMLASSLAGLGTTAPFKTVRTNNLKPADPSKPAILHLILDEHVGIDGLQDPGANPAKTRSRLRQAYVETGFRVYDRAFSDHLHTVNALSAIMNFGQPSSNRGGKGGVRINQNHYFDYLRQKGYRISVAQAAFANFCTEERIASCTTYNQQNLGALEHFALNIIDRSLLTYFKILDQSETLLNLSYVFDWLLARLHSEKTYIQQSTLKRKSRTNTLAGLVAFEELISTLKRAKPGEVYFAHILLPHTPYVVRSNCSPRSYMDWEDRDSHSSLEFRQRRYLDQVWCAAKKVREAISVLNQSPAAKNFVVIVHGDHGSRLTKSDPNVANRGKYDDADMVAGFSTLFAVKANNIAAGYDRRPASVASLLGHFAESDFKVAPFPNELDSKSMVFLDDENWNPSERTNLPDEWLLPPDTGAVTD